MEYFGVFEELFGVFVLISFRSDGGILSDVFLPMVLQVLQDYASL
jgi:hypothetical protein